MKLIKAKFNKWLTPRRVYVILKDASLLMTIFVCLIAADALIENDLFVILVGTVFASIIHLTTKMAGYIDRDLEGENKVTLDPSKGKFAVIYYNEHPLKAVRLSDDKAEVI